MNNYARNLIQIFRTITVVGDSLTAGFACDGDVRIRSCPARGERENWPSFLARRTGCEVYNNALGGTKAKEWRETFAETVNFKTDCYIVALGANDHRYGLPVGTPSDIKENYEENADSFYGNYDALVRHLLKFNPAAHIFVLTMPSPEDKIDAKGAYFNDYNEAIRLVAKKNFEKVHLIDLHKNHDKEYTEGLIARHADHEHYTPIAYNMMSTIIEDDINEFIYTHDDLFHMTPYK